MSNTIELEIDGIEEMENLLKKYESIMESMMPSLLYEEGIRIIHEAILQTPVDTGNLRDSAHVTFPEKKGTAYSISIGFGGPAGTGNISGLGSNNQDVNYAWAQHENPFYRHTVGNMQYLLRPALEAKATLADRFAAEIKAELEQWGF